MTIKNLVKIGRIDFRIKMKINLLIDANHQKEIKRLIYFKLYFYPKLNFNNKF